MFTCCNFQTFWISSWCFGNPISFWEYQKFLNIVQKVTSCYEKMFLNQYKKFWHSPKNWIFYLYWYSEIWLISTAPYYCFPSNYLIDFKAETITYSYLALKPLWLVVSSTATIVYKDKKNSHTWLSTVC